jgi:transcriptional regulator with XRE-family HTH domain
MLGATFRAARLERGWTQHEAAGRLGVSQGYVSLVESGRRQASRALLRRAQRVLGLPAATLPTGQAHQLDAAGLAGALAALGYPGFAFLRSRLAREDTLCYESMTRAERAWLRSHRPADARRWNLLTDVVTSSPTPGGGSRAGSSPSR